MVEATPVPNANAAMKLKNAAHRTACVGLNTRVETTVAIELAASWKPLRKSNTSATKMMKIASEMLACVNCVVASVAARRFCIFVARRGGLLLRKIAHGLENPCH